MGDARNHFPKPIRVFRPKWRIHFDDGTVFPIIFANMHPDTAAESTALDDTKRPSTATPFDPEWDIVFIDNYVFENCERPDATISFDVEDGLPESLDLPRNVGIESSSLLMDKSDVWCKKLRFILRNFRMVKRITIIASVVFDDASPNYLSKTSYFTDIQKVSLEDRIRHGILFGQELQLNPYCPKTLRASDFAIQAWNDLPNHWPSWKKKKENLTAPCLFITAMVYFRQEWDSLHGKGGPWGACVLGNRRSDIANIAVKNGSMRTSSAGVGKKRSMEARPPLRKHSSFLSLKTKKSKLSLKKNPSMPLISGQGTRSMGQNWVWV